MTTSSGYFDYLFNELADPHIADYPFMQSPWQVLIILGVYLYGVLYYLPKHMTNRKPYDLNKLLTVYNVLQVVACVYIIYEILNSGWLAGKYKIIGCYPPDYSDKEMGDRMVRIVWWTMILKIVELLETVFFVLRKKYNQVSGLHLYHHTSTVMIGWIGAKYYPGGSVTFPPMLNCFVHIVMYIYYLLSSLGPDMQKRLTRVKKYVTLLQIVQLFIIVFQISQMLLPSCSLKDGIGYIFVGDILINLVFFFNFYAGAYMNKKKTRTS